MIKAKLYMNVHWMVLYNLKVFCSDMKFKMAAQGSTLTVARLPGASEMRLRASENGTQLVRWGK
jgi:hypothetical protein